MNTLLLKIPWYSSLFCIFQVALHHAAYSQMQLTQHDVKLLMSKDVYHEVNGFFIDDTERLAIHNQGGDATYGEITYEGAQILLDDLKLSKRDVFYDLGCGVGKLIVQVALTTPVKKAIGIELSSTRFNHALSAENKLKKRHLIHKKKICFYNENILTASFSDATVVFMCSTCFSDDLMRAITHKLKSLKKGARVVTLRTLPEPHPFKLIKTYQLPMTWAHTTAVYLYQLS